MMMVEKVEGFLMYRKPVYPMFQYLETCPESGMSLDQKSKPQLSVGSILSRTNDAAVITYEDILNVLKSNVNDKNPQILKRKVPKIKKWLSSNIFYLESLSMDDVKTIGAIFGEFSCWDGLALNHRNLGLKLVGTLHGKQKDNPFFIVDRYYFACKYCLQDKVVELFTLIFGHSKSAYHDSVSDEKILNDLVLYFHEANPIQYFWTKRFNLNGSLEELNVVQCLSELSVILNHTSWEEAVDYFLQKLPKDLSKEQRRDIFASIVMPACIHLKDAEIVEMCVSKMNRREKAQLLQQDYSQHSNFLILNLLADGYHYNRFKEMFNSISNSPMESKEYFAQLQHLAQHVLSKRDFAFEAKDTFMYLWRHALYSKVRQQMCDNLNDVVPVITLLMFDLVNDGNCDFARKESELLEVLAFVGKDRREEVKELVIHELIASHGMEDFVRVDEIFSVIPNR